MVFDYSPNSHEITVLLPNNNIIRAATRVNRIFAYAKAKAQISFAVTAKLISAFVFATRIVLFLFYLNPKFQASSSFLSLYRPVCVGPGRKPRRPVFSRRGSLYTRYHEYSIRLTLHISSKWNWTSSIFKRYSAINEEVDNFCYQKHCSVYCRSTFVDCICVFNHHLSIH